MGKSKTSAKKKPKKRQRTERIQMSSVSAVLAVADIARASRFYQTLGFVEQAAYPRADGELTVAFLRHGSSLLILGRKDELHYSNAARAKLIRKGPYGLGITLILAVVDLDAVYEVVKRAKLEILLEPVDEFYGERVFFFLDPDGYEWKISQTIAEVSQDEVADIIGSYQP